MFTKFTPLLSQYQTPVREVILPTTVFPTNSWLENAITDGVSDNNRVINAIPWYWLPSYSSNTFNLAFSGTVPFVNSNIDGNLSIQENPRHDITIGKINGQLLLTSVDEFTGEFSQRSLKGMITGYPMRGSPYATFIFYDAPISITFNSFPTITSFDRLSTGYQVSTLGSYTTDSVTAFIETDRGLVVKDLSFYQGTQSLNIPVNALLENNSCLTIEMQDLLVTINLGSSYTSSYSSPQIKDIIINSDRITPQIMLIMYSGDIFSVIANLHSKTLTAQYVTQKNFSWFIFTTATLIVSGNSLITTGKFSGLLQIAGFIGDTLPPLYTKYAGNYIYKSQVYNYDGGENDNRWSFNLGWSINISNPSNNNVLWLLPNHWNLMTLTGINKLEDIAYNNFIYGDLTYYEITSYTATVLVSHKSIPRFLNTSGFSPEEIDQLTTQLVDDCQTLNKLISSTADPYGFGTAAASLGKLLELAQALSITDYPVIIQTGNILHSVITQWLQGTNSQSILGNPYQLQYDSLWGGMVVPGDYLATNHQSTLRARGNSYYQDHHSHWGYLLSAIHSLEIFGKPLSFTNEIICLLKDFVNPQTDNFSWKTRHKDWYTGHSWGSGIIESKDQLAGSGEVVNGYYQAYLMAKLLRQTPLAHAAGICMWLEILASHQYYQLASPGSKQGLFTLPGSVAAIHSSGKSFSREGQIPPHTWAMGIYGLQAIPFTEISPLLLPKEWIDTLTAGDPSYSLTDSLLSTNKGGFSEILTGLKILAFSKRAISNKGVREAYYNIDKALVPDSLSYTLYWLLKLRRMKISQFSNTTVVSSSRLQISADLDDGEILNVYLKYGNNDKIRLPINLRSVIKNADVFYHRGSVKNLITYASIKVALYQLIYGSVSEKCLHKSGHKTVLRAIINSPFVDYAQCLSNPDLANLFW